MTTVMKSIASYVAERGITDHELATTAGLDRKLVKAIISGNFTPSPVHRQRLAAALGVSLEEVSWGHAVPVEHLRGNGPQCGRPT
jgi:ribosome-binding protein aMBF1 (putative translation factor)